jgi:hypothetical protein
MRTHRCKSKCFQWQQYHFLIDVTLCLGAPPYVCHSDHLYFILSLTRLFSFYSWRRYCNKHQIKLGGYMMNKTNSTIPEGDIGNDASMLNGSMGVNTQQERDFNEPRSRSPTPPRALFRSTTGKGVAFTDDDITFLTRFMEYRK